MAVGQRWPAAVGAGRLGRQQRRDALPQLSVISSTLIMCDIITQPPKQTVGSARPAWWIGSDRLGMGVLDHAAVALCSVGQRTIRLVVSGLVSLEELDQGWGERFVGDPVPLTRQAAVGAVGQRPDHRGRHDPRLGASCSAVSIDVSIGGLGACTRKQPQAMPTSN